MKVDLNLPADKAQDFLLYFTAEAKKHSGGLFPFGDSRAGFEDEGSYVARLSGEIQYDDRKILVHWTIPQSADGTIPYIEYETIDFMGDGKAEESVNKEFRGHNTN